MADGGRKVTIVAGIYTLLQGLLWSAIAVLSISIYNCGVSNPLVSWADHGVNVYTLIYASYFNGSSCDGGPYFHGISTPVASTERTYHWMISYAVLSIIWVPVSVLLIVAGASKVEGSRGNYYYVPWIINTFVITVVDLIAIVMYSIDIAHTMSSDDYVKFLGGHGTFKKMTGVSGTDVDTVAPAVIMVLFFSRFILFWFVNASLLFHCFKESRQIRKFNVQGSISTLDYMDDERFRTWNRPTLSQQALHTNSDKQLCQVLPQPEKTNKQKTVVLEKNINDKNHVNENVQSKDDGDVMIISSSLYKTDEFGIPIEEVRIPRIYNNSYSESPGSDTPICSPVFDYLGRPARPTSRTESDRTNRPDDGKSWNPTSQELRGQAPWSYLHPTTPPPPEVARPQPDIPAPDYTIHPRYQRSSARPHLPKKPYNNRRVHGLQ